MAEVGEGGAKVDGGMATGLFSEERPLRTSSNLREPCDRPHDGGARATSVSWVTRNNTALTIAAGCLVPVLYLLYVAHYSVNDLLEDDWATLPIVQAAVHGHLSLSQLWGQHNETRVFTANVIFAIFGLIDRYDTRSMVIVNAVVFIASYAIVLALFRHYIGERLSPIPVLLIGVVWFSLADVQNSLWAYQLPWYFVVFFFVVSLYALFLPARRRTLWFVVAVLSAIAASLSMIQGFIVWPIGVIAILWGLPRTRRALIETAVWIGSMLVTIAIYLPGYNFNDNGCHPSWNCSPEVALDHPLRTLNFLFVMIGNVIPEGRWTQTTDGIPTQSYSRFELVGVGIFAVALFICVQSWRSRKERERFPLPLLLIVFSLLFDIMLSLTRSSAGMFDAIFGNRYVMPNLILLTGIGIYGWAHIPQHRPALRAPLRVVLTWIAVFTLATFMVVQAVTSIGFGLKSAQSDSLYLTDQARVAVNLDRMPPSDRGCEAGYVFDVPEAWNRSNFLVNEIHTASEVQLGEFQPNSDRYYRELGLPVDIVDTCSGR